MAPDGMLACCVRLDFRADSSGCRSSVKNNSLGEYLSTGGGGLRLCSGLRYNHAATLIRSARNRPGRLPMPARDKAAALIANAADTFAR